MKIWGVKYVRQTQKKPEYDVEKQFDAFLQELSAAYEEADSMRGLAQELNITLTVDY